MIDPVLKSCLQALLRRERQRQFWLRMAQAWAAAAGVGLVLLGLRWVLGGPGAEGWTALALLAAIAILAGWVGWRRREPDLRQVAREVEQRHPELEGRLLTAVQQETGPRGELGFLQDRLVHEVLRHASGADWARSAGWRRVLLAHGAHATALVLFAGVVWSLHASSARSTTVGVLPASAIVVTPGDTELERGNSLVVLARFGGAVPVQAELVLQPVTGMEQRLALVRSLEEQVFGVTVPNLTEDLAYRVEVEGRRTRDYVVKVFEHPRMEKADADLTYPAYTGLGTRRVEEVRRLSAVAGTVLDLSVQLNKPVASARLVGRETATLELNAAPDRPLALLAGQVLTVGDTYRLELMDDEGRTNRAPAQFVIEVIENRTPELKLTRPRGDQRPSPLEELVFEGTVWDDFGLLAYGLGWTRAGEEPRQVEMGGAVPGRETRSFEYLLPLEEAGVAPDDLILWYVWGDDFGPDGQIRRTTSDLFFGEVRPFDEIFREGQSPTRGGQAQEQSGEGGEGGQSPSAQLAELQKEIVNATWNLRRSHAAVSAEYAAAAAVVRDAQFDALDQAEAVAGVTDPGLAALWSAVRRSMGTASERLEEAPKSVAALTPALAAEQSAYQALLRLQEREYAVAAAQNQPGQRRSSRQQAMQRQLDQLDLQQADDRYETESQAQAQTSPQRTEQLQILSRLRELAQRQQDVNQRLQELQTAQLEARTEEEREQVRRELQRLREEQQRMLADLDELRQRMDRPENQSRLAEQRQQLEDTRETMRRSADATQQEAVSQALADGTRAQRQMESVRDDLRRESAGEFAEDLHRMRSDARELVSRQEAIQQQMDELLNPQQRMLSNEQEKQELVNQLAEQKERLNSLVQDTTRIAAEAEVAEPLASRELHDALRAFVQDDVAFVTELEEELVNRGMLTRTLQERLRAAARDPGAKSVEATAEMIRQDYLTVADRAEERTRAGVARLATGVERAAERVLGDDTEALRRARQQLDDATRALEREMAQAEQQEERPTAGSATLASRDEQDPAGSTPSDGAGQDQAGSRPTQEQGQEPRGAQRGGAASAVDLDRLLAGDSRPGVGEWSGPITGDGFLAWSDQLREVEELLEGSEWRNDVALARDRARVLRQRVRGQSERPDWATVRFDIMGPLVEVRDRVHEELARRDVDRALIPIDRDPVPGRYVELVREYYEELGRGR